MPMKFVVRTSVLSKKWRYTWTLVTNLYFDDNLRNSVYDLDSLTKFVDQVLKFRKTSQVNLFRLHFSSVWVRKSSVLNWIDKAVRLNVRELDIQVIMLELPLSMFTCKTLTKLRLKRASYDYSVWEIPCLVNLPCLKILDINVLQNPFVSAFKLIRGCPMLESLSLEIGWRNNEEDYIFNIPTLKWLKVTMLKCVSVINKVVLNVPNLKCLVVGGILCSVFVMEDVPSLIKATVSFYEIRFDHLWVELLKGLSGVTSLRVQHVNFLIEDFKIPFSLSLPIFPNMKHLELKNFWHSELLPQFLKSSPELKRLCIEKASRFLFKPKDYSHWIEPELVPACMLTNLTTIKFSKFEGQICDIRFLEYMLRNAEVLKTVTITWENSRIKEETQVSAHLLKLPRASTCCEIHFHGNSSASTSS